MSTLQTTNLKNPSSASNNIVLDSSGRVGIGSTAPSDLLNLKQGSDDSLLRFRKSDDFNAGSVGHAIDSRNVAGTTTTQLTLRGNPLSFWNNGEAMRIDSSNRLLVGTSTGIVTGSSVQAALQVVDNSNLSAAFRMNRNDSSGPIIVFGKSRSTSDGGFAVLQSGDELGAIRFAGADGGDLQTQGAAIAAFVDGTPGANDMPGRLVFSTCPDGSASPVERVRINSGGEVSIGGDSSSTNYNGYLYCQKDGVVAYFNRGVTDGTIIEFRQGGVAEGTISVSGTTVSYNGAHLSR